MSATMTGITCITGEVESIPSQGRHTRPTPMSDACGRCGGLLVDEHCMDMDIGEIGRGYWAKRCIQCGDMIDETILRNRYAPPQTLQEMGPAADLVKELAAWPPHHRKGRYADVSHASPTFRSH